MNIKRIGLVLVIIALASFAFPRQTESTDFSGYVKSWASAWQNAKYNFEAYQNFYDQQFWANYKSKSGMDFNAWMADKRRKVGKAACINVYVNNIKQVDQVYDVSVVTFTQRYTSDSYCDIGTKTLYIVDRGQGLWKIIGEEQPSVKKCPERCTP